MIKARQFLLRIKGAIDDRIREEQARQAKTQQTVARTPGPRRRPQDASPTRRSSRQRDALPGKSPDPGEFAIAEDEGAVTRPLPQQEGTNGTQETPREKDGNGEEPPADGGAKDLSSNEGTEKPHVPLIELPPDVETRLRRLEKLEIKYGELLKAYRAAHARVQAIEPFEATLRESTPLTSISDPSALSEYLAQISTKSGMVLDELKRVSGERDEYKKKADAAEIETRRLEKDVQNLKAQVDARPKRDAEVAANTGAADVVTISSSEKTSSVTSPKSTASRIPSLSIFSPKSKPTKLDESKDEVVGEDLFSFDSEVPKLESQLTERQEQIDSLTTQVSKLKNDLKVARESTEGMVQTLEITTQELNSLRDAKESFESTEEDLKKRILDLESEAKQAVNAADYEKKLSELREEMEDARSQFSSTRQLVDTLERREQDAKKELDDALSKIAGLNSELADQKKTIDALLERVQQKDDINKDLEDSLAFAKKAEREHERVSAELVTSKKKVQTIQNVMDNLRAQLALAENTASETRDQQNKSNKNVDQPSAEPSAVTTTTPATQDDAASGPKKKNKKKKKGKDATAHADTDRKEVDADTHLVKAETIINAPASDAGDKVAKLSERIHELEHELEGKRSTIDRLSAQLRDQDELKEEIETLRDDLLHQGEEHVEARDVLKTAQVERQRLQETVDKLEKDLTVAREQAKNDSEAAETHQTIKEELETKTMAHDQAKEELEEIKTTVGKLQSELTTAEQLASSRFKDITDLKELLNRAQPELRSLRGEVEELRKVKDELKNRSGELTRLESAHEGVKLELKNLAKRLSTQDTDMRSLQSKVETETRLRERAEGEIEAKESEIRSAEARRNGAIEMHESTKHDLSKSREEVQGLQAKLRDVSDQLASHERQVSSLKEELSLKSALHSSSQSLVQSLRDQMHELNVQTREVTGRSESMEEELAEAQRMLAEHTRQSQTMRMLLNQAESSTEARIREMKERMDAAIEERDRLEDENSVSSRRLTREVEEAKNKAREGQRQLKTLEAEREDLETRSREWRKLREDLEYSNKAAEREAEETRNAMKGLREALDESERQVREIESQKAELRQQADEAKERVERLSTANRRLTEDIKSLQLRTGTRPTTRPGLDSGLQSSRTSIDSSTARSPAPPASRAGLSSTPSLPRSETPTNTSAASGGLSQGTVDYVYLKNVLLQFLNQKDKGHQRQLVPVIGMLLHFDERDQQRWNAAITAR